MPTTPHDSPRDPSPKFQTLFADPRHYRGDCRLMRTAIRRGWLKDAPQADRDALMARFNAAVLERHADDPDGTNVRALMAEALAVLEIGRADLADAKNEYRARWGGVANPADTRPTGRPRERWQVGDYQTRIDANELRREWKAAGRNLQSMEAINVAMDTPAGRIETRIALAVVADARYGWRVWLVCPVCKCRRAHLYTIRAGVRCRKCAGISC